MKKNDRESAIDAINRWIKGEATANGIRAEFGLERVELENADDFIVNCKAFEEIMKPIERVGTIAKLTIKTDTTDLDEAIVKADLLVETLKKAKSLADELAGKEKATKITDVVAEVAERMKKETRTRF